MMATRIEIANAFNAFPRVGLEDLKAGDTLFADDGFDCLEAGPVKVEEDDGRLYVRCHAGCHYLDGQTDDEGKLSGLVKMPEPANA